jgi:hypothetical protein
VGRSYACESPGLGLDHRTEVITPPRALLLQALPDRLQLRLADCLVEQLAVRLRAVAGGCAECGVAGVSGQQGVGSQPAQSRSARPAVGACIVDHAGAYRVEVDVAHAAQQMRVTVDQAGFVAAFPERAGPAVARVELAHVLAPELLHQSCDRTDFRRCQQQVHTVAHEYVGVQGDAGREQGFAQQCQVARAVIVVENARQAVVAALDDVLRNTGEVKAGAVGPLPNFAVPAGWHASEQPPFDGADSASFPCRFWTHRPAPQWRRRHPSRRLASGQAGLTLTDEAAARPPVSTSIARTVLTFTILSR